MIEHAPSAANLRLARQITADWRPPTDQQLDRVISMLGAGHETTEVVART